MRERSSGTSTSNFGVGRREAHDASGFYRRFHPPELSDDDEINVAPDLGDGCIVGDARKMAELPDNSVALVVTSPPYFVGKDYEAELGQGGVPASYAEFLDLLFDVFAECKRVLEPGGRIAVNVANLGRKPYRSLSADVIGILEELGFLLRGEVIWKKGEGAAGNCAWGSFGSAANPVLRDLTERVVIAGKGRFNRAKTADERRELALPHENTITSDEFMSATLDVWDIEPESAKRVNHPAPFPVQLPERLIQLYTFEGDLVLDPFLGSGSTLVAARRTRRRGVGYDLDPAYVERAQARLAEEGSPLSRPMARDTAGAVAKASLVEAGFRIVGENKRIPKTGVVMSFVAVDADDCRWYFDVTGAFTTTRGGLLRNENVWKCLGRAAVLRNRQPSTPLVLVTSDLPKPGSDGDVALRAAGPAAFFDAVALLSPSDSARLAAYAAGGRTELPLPGFWTEPELGSRR